MFEWMKLRRFMKAQRPVYQNVLAELSAGKKETHWMWFIFPQLYGIGHSETSKLYGLHGRDEARAYWDKAVLGTRLRECVALLLSHGRLGAHEILGSPDDLKLHSCLTLFSIVAPEEKSLIQALDRFYAGKLDPLTLELLSREPH